jgi:hypothetical protein
MRPRLVTALLIVSLSGWIASTYFWIDRSISLSYARQSADADSASTRRLERLLEAAWSGRPEDAVFKELQAEAARHPAGEVVVKREADAIWFGETRFTFERGKLKSVGGSN